MSDDNETTFYTDWCWPGTPGRVETYREPFRVLQRRVQRQLEDCVYGCVEIYQTNPSWRMHARMIKTEEGEVIVDQPSRPGFQGLVSTLTAAAMKETLREIIDTYSTSKPAKKETTEGRTLLIQRCTVSDKGSEAWEDLCVFIDDETDVERQMIHALWDLGFNKDDRYRVVLVVV